MNNHQAERDLVSQKTDTDIFDTNKQCAKVEVPFNLQTKLILPRFPLQNHELRMILQSKFKHTVKRKGYFSHLRST